jgi:hypothetical protein
MREDRMNIKLQDCENVHKSAPSVDVKVKDYILCAGLSIADADAADTDT